MKKIDYIYISLLSVIIVLLVLLVFRPIPKPAEPKRYSEVQCEVENFDKAFGAMMGSGSLWLGSKGKKAEKAKKAVRDYEKLMAKRLKEGWRVLPNELNILCFMR